MNGWHDEARRLYEECGNYREVARRLGRPVQTVYVALTDDNRRRRAYKREWERKASRDERYRGRCPECGGLLGINTRGLSGRCADCCAKAAEAKAREVERRWNAGESMREIGAGMGWSSGMLSKTMDRYRAAGYDLPYRQRLKRPRHPEQVAA